MGMSKKKSKSKTKNEPWKPAQPYILENLKQQQDVFNASQPQLMEYAGQQRDTYGRLAPGAEAGIVSCRRSGGTTCSQSDGAGWPATLTA